MTVIVIAWRIFLSSYVVKSFSSRCLLESLQDSSAANLFLSSLVWSDRRLLWSTSENVLICRC